MLIGVEITTDSGRYFRYSDVEQLSTSQFSFVNNTLVYPDLRVDNFYIYCRSEGVSPTNVPTSWTLFGRYPAEKSKTLNLAYVLFSGAIDLETIASGQPQMPDVNVQNAQKERDPNKIYVSEAGRPFSFDASRVYYVGSSADQSVQRITSSAVPLSTGQYGDYPVIVFCRSSIWSIATGEDGLPSAIVPLTLEMGAVNPWSVLTEEGQIYFVSDDSLYVLDRDLTLKNVGEKVFSRHVTGAFAPSERSFILYYSDKSRSRREIWYGVDGQDLQVLGPGDVIRSFVYSIPLNVWGSYYRRFRAFFPGTGTDAGKHLGLTADDAYHLVELETGASSAPMDIKLYPVAIERAEVWKRIWRLGLRSLGFSGSVNYEVYAIEGSTEILQASGTINFATSDVVNLWNGHAKAIGIRIYSNSYNGVLTNFEVDYEVRYEHRAAKWP